MILYFNTRAESDAAVVADGGDIRTNVSLRFSQTPNWVATVGDDRQPPPQIFLSQRDAMSRLTPAEKADIFAAVLAGNTNADFAVVLAPTTDDHAFDVAAAADVFAQFVTDGLLTPARAAEVLS